MKISDDKRREVAAELRRQAAYSSGAFSEWWCRLQETVTGVVDFADPQETCQAIADLIEPNAIDGETSDGYHTFNELYHHRAVLFSVIVAAFSDRAWKSKLHADGSMFDGMFIVGIGTPDGQATYHYDIDPYWSLFRCAELERAPEWDGHTPGQAIERIGKLADLIDRNTCKMVDCVLVHGSHSVGMYCSSCGAEFEQEKPGFMWKYCPNCGAEVVE